MRYKVSRTYLDKVAGEITMTRKKSAQIIERAVRWKPRPCSLRMTPAGWWDRFSHCPGDEATATCQSGGTMYVIIAVRAE